jgi:hypothetical protein
LTIPELLRISKPGTDFQIRFNLEVVLIERRNGGKLSINLREKPFRLKISMDRKEKVSSNLFCKAACRDRVSERTR